MKPCKLVMDLMLSGKAVERAIRGHFLIESALIVLLLADLFTCSPD